MSTHSVARAKALLDELDMSIATAPVGAKCRWSPAGLEVATQPDQLYRQLDEILRKE